MVVGGAVVLVVMTGAAEVKAGAAVSGPLEQAEANSADARTSAVNQIRPTASTLRVDQKGCQMVPRLAEAETS